MRLRVEDFNPRVVNGRNVTEFTNHEDLTVYQGVDSQAFHFGDWILHKFNRQIPIARVQLMKEVTDEVATYAPRYSANIGSWGHTQLEVGRVAKVFDSKESHIAYAVEPYVGGYRPEQEQNRYLDEFLADFSSDMVKRTGHRGISIIAPNTKMNKLNHGVGVFARYMTTITDICQYMTELT